jgi:NAD(P)-dependent dehydrogenase (short-subunit alcohol dehydrogenase family)
MPPALLQGQHALVTGASRGIGAAVAATLEQAGAKVSRAARSWPDQRPGCFATDVTDASMLAVLHAGAVSLHGPIDILVNNAGAAESAPFARTDAALLRRMLALNLESVFALTGLALPGMIARGHGRIINIASTAGLKGYPYVTAYTAAKHGVIGLTRALALEVARSGVTVNAVCPGYTETELVAAAAQNIVAKTGRSAEEAKAELARSNPQGRLVMPQEVAAAVLYLAGPDAGAVNGIALSVSGGETG